MTTLVYFAWVRERIGVGHEQLALPPDVRTVGELLDWLAGCSPGHAEALAERDRLRFAVNHQYVDPDFPIGPTDEVAIFPPVTGG